MNNLRKLPKFIHQCMTIGEIPTSYKVSLTYEEQLMWFCRFLEEEVIPVVNNNSEVVQELKTFVENYFDNLDVQEEINNKLDEMAEDGTLEEIITEYLNVKGMLTFNTVSEMKLATNLINGSFVKTYGFRNINDLGGAFYKIRTITNQDTVNEMDIIALSDENLIAELIIGENINIRQLGAYADDTHDDSPYLQQAIAIALRYYSHISYFSETSMKIFIPSGTYKISTAINNNLDNLYLYGDRPILKGSGNNFINFSWGHKSIIENINLSGFERALNYDMTDMDKSMCFINKVDFLNCNYGIYITNKSSIYNIENCKFHSCYKTIYNNDSDAINVNNCWISDYIYEEEEESSMVFKNGEISIRNSFFIPGGNQISRNLAWIELSSTGGVIRSLLIDNCRFSAENGWHDLINFKSVKGEGSFSSLVGLASITIKNCGYIIARNLINLFTFCPKITIENNCISATKFLDLRQNFEDINYNVTNTYYQFNKIVIKHNQINSTELVDNYPNELLSKTYDDINLHYHATSNNMDYYIGNYSAGSQMVLHNKLMFNISYYSLKSGTTGWHNLLAVVNFKISSNQVVPVVTIIGDNDETLDLQILFDYKNNSGTVDVENASNIPNWSNDYYNVTMKLSIANANLNALIVKPINLLYN